MQRGATMSGSEKRMGLAQIVVVLCYEQYGRLIFSFIFYMKSKTLLSFLARLFKHLILLGRLVLVVFKRNTI